MGLKLHELAVYRRRDTTLDEFYDIEGQGTDRNDDCHFPCKADGKHKSQIYEGRDEYSSYGERPI